MQAAIVWNISAVNRGGPWLTGLACALALSACTPAEPSQSAPLTDPSSLEEPRVPVERDRASPQDVVIAWDERKETFRAGALSATLHNNTDAPLTMRLSAESVDPHGEVMVRALGEHTLGARETKPVEVRLDRVAVQTVGVSSALRLIAQFEVDAPRMTGASEAVVERASRVVTATTVHVTFDPDFRDATIRSIAAQATVHAPAYIDDETPLPTAMRVFDEDSDAMRDVDMVAARKAQNRPTVSFVDLPTDALIGDSPFAPPSAVKGAVP